MMLRFWTLTLIAAPLTATADAGVDVVTDIPILRILVESVQNDVGSALSVMDGGASPHDWSLRPSDAAAMANADLVVWVGEGLSPQFATALKAIADDAVSLPLMDVPNTWHREFTQDDDHAGHEDHDEHGHEAKAQGHDHGDDDPHAWLSPDNAVVWTFAIAETLAQMDPGHAEHYVRAATEAANAITAAQIAVSAQISAHSPKYVEAHASLGYFGDTFDISSIAVLSDGHAAEPGPRKLARVETKIAEAEAKCMIVETGTASRLAVSVASRHDLSVVEVDLTGQNATGQTYADWLRTLGSALQAC